MSFDNSYVTFNYFFIWANDKLFIFKSGYGTQIVTYRLFVYSFVGENIAYDFFGPHDIASICDFYKGFFTLQMNNN